jgi:DNA-binding protein HU-beta
MTCLNLWEISRDCTEGLNISKKVAEELTRRVISATQDALEAGKSISLHGIGRLHVQDVPARKYRNPATGGQVDVAATRKVVFSRTRGENEIK